MITHMQNTRLNRLAGSWLSRSAHINNNSTVAHPVRAGLHKRTEYVDHGVYVLLHKADPLCIRRDLKAAHASARFSLFSSIQPKIA